MSRYDYSQVPRERLEAMARVSEVIRPHPDHNQREVIEFEGVRDNVRRYALVKTRSQYDKEIASIVRGEVRPPFGVNYWDWETFIDLVAASREAPEE